MIGIQVAGKNNRISLAAFVRSLNLFLDLLRDVDCAISRRPKGSVRWEIESLKKNSPALVEIAGVPRIKEMDYSHAIQESVLDGLEQLAEKPEQPNFYSYSAMQRAKQIAEAAQKLKFVHVFTASRRTQISERILTNVEYLVASGSKSLGSIRGSLDAISVHKGHEFRVWSPQHRRPIVCRFDKALLVEVAHHLQQQVEVIGELQRNPKGEPVLMKVDSFVPLEPLAMKPDIGELRGIVPDLFDGVSLRNYLEGLRSE